MDNKLFRWLPIFIWVIIICVLSFSSLKNISLPTFFSADKVGHIVMYFVLELLFLIPLNWNTRAFRWATISAIVFSLTTEFVQHFFVENRFGELADFIANLIGIAACWLILSKKYKT